jgi:hypothetical protein
LTSAGKYTHVSLTNKYNQLKLPKPHTKTELL